ncbi:MAG TPA: hypothetical protein VIV15_05565 [Anaerolineales bacterium]
MNDSPLVEYKFWLVWNPRGPYGGHPTYRHASQAEAEEEGMRLAREHSGQTFFILEAVALIRTSTPPLERLPLEEIAPQDVPF